MLILGPNRAFLGYISAVLPALGEVDVEQTTVEGLLERGPLRGADGEEAATVKHDVRMAEVLRRALYERVTAPADPIAVPDGSYRWRVGREEFRDIVDGALREATPYGVGRERVLSRTVAVLLRQAEARGQVTNAAWTRRMARAVTGHVDAVWPAVRPEEVVAELLGDPAALAVASDGILTLGERSAILWARPPRSFKSARWSAADLVLLDEVSGLLERPRGTATSSSTRRRTSRRCSAAPSPAGASTARSRCSATWRRAPRRGRPWAGGTTWPTWASLTRD